MTKFVRVMKDNFLREEWAILSLRPNKTETQWWYSPIDNMDIWDATSVNWNEYITKRIIDEHISLWSGYFERVYTDDIKWKVLKTAEQLKESYKEAFIG